jgi:PAS domain S-box-containing protein
MRPADPARPASDHWHSPWLSWLLPGSGICIALFGLTVDAGWYAHWVVVVSGGPGLPSMKFNAALGFVLCGAALALMTTAATLRKTVATSATPATTPTPGTAPTSSTRKRTAVALSALAAALMLATLVEYRFGVSLGVDQLLIHDYLTPVNALPGRMSPLTATCFIFVAVGLMLSGLGRARAWQMAAAGLMACLVGVIAAVSLGGYLSGMEAAYGWERYTRMAVHTAAAMLLLGTALLGWTWEVSRRQRINLARWLPLAGAVTLMAMVALLAVVSLRELKNSYRARKSSYEALVAAQALLGDLTDVTRGMSSYVLTGQREALIPFHRGIDAIPPQLAALSAQSLDSAAPPDLEKPLADDLLAVIDYARRLIGLRDTRGLQAAIALVESGEGRIKVDRARDDLQAFTDQVHRLVLQRDAQAELIYRHTVAILIVASAMAALLLGFAHVAVSREGARRRRVEARLQGLTAFQTAILDSANYAITSTGLDGIVTSFNATAERWLGYQATEVVGSAKPSLWYDTEEASARSSAMAQELGIVQTPEMDVFGAYLKHGKRYESEWHFRRRDNTRFPVWLSMAPLNDSVGSTIGYLGVFQDITERKRQDAELRLSEERFRRAFDDAPIGMALVDPEQGQWLQVNAALCSMLGYGEAELLQKNRRGIIHPEDVDKEQAPAREVLDGNSRGYQVEVRYLHRDGAAVYVNVTVSLVSGADGTPLYFVAQIENITQRREMDRMKLEFIATVSHELRTPLTSIRGSLGLIAAGAMGELPEKVSPMVQIALQNCERLVLIINDILDMEKIESGKSQLQISAVSVASLLQQALALNQAYADKFGVTLVLEPPPAQLQALADADRLMQVITNLLSNAAKFSAAGTSVRVRARADEQQVRFEVEDEGSGIPEEFRARIFGKFAQAQSSAGRHFGGTGLGLAICKSLVEQMGGRIHFESRVGGGTIFFVELPGVDADTASLQLLQLSETARHRTLNLDPAMARERAAALGREPGVLPQVLHVENDVDLSTVLKASLAGRAELVLAGTLAAGRQRLAESHFAAVVLDPGLPDGSGLALLDEIERSPRRPPVVILSVTEMPFEIRRRVAAAFVKSRVSEIELAQTIMAMIHYGAERYESAAPSAAAASGI